jgi:hypothetical protein
MRSNSARSGVVSAGITVPFADTMPVIKHAAALRQSLIL